MLNDKWGFVDKNGKLAIYNKFDDARNFSNGVVPVKVGDKWGYIDKSGEFVVTPQYESASPFYDDGYAVVTLENKKQSIIDTTFKYIGIEFYW